MHIYLYIYIVPLNVSTIWVYVFHINILVTCQTSVCSVGEIINLNILIKCALMYRLCRCITEPDEDYFR